MPGAHGHPNAVVLLLVGGTVLQLFSAYLAQGRGGGRHFEYVMDGAMQFANPDYAISNVGSANPGLTGNLTYTASLQPRAVGLAPAIVSVRAPTNRPGSPEQRRSHLLRP